MIIHKHFKLPDNQTLAVSNETKIDDVIFMIILNHSKLTSICWKLLRIYAKQGDQIEKETNTIVLHSTENPM